MEISSKRQQKIERVIKNRQAGLTLALEDIHDPHNAAAILRTCDAFGIQQAYFIFDQEKPYNPGRVGKSSSSSANKWLDFKTFKSTEEAISDLKKDGYWIIGTALSSRASNLFETKFSQEKIAVIIGNEHQGMSKQAMDLCDQLIVIPMRGFVESLNASVSAALVIAEITRQRLASDTLKPLDEESQARLTKDFLGR